ncbi:MAG: succinate dehydrogenase/fumarate reductase iron-sulfur subunit [Verrucomicrobiales bacterium]|nr:succinate dehydrogenase/fumarate reductase iron-sulfur subunit [Verrucomicrobiales bacterium]
MKVRLKVWRQPGPNAAGGFETYDTPELNPNMSFLEMLDVVNDELTRRGNAPIAFAHDCREGICGTCGLTVNGRPHGPGQGTATCQLYMRNFEDGATITIEPFRARPFPVLQDLIVDRAAFDRIMQKGGFVSVRTGAPQDANALPVAKPAAELAMDAAQCIGCGACVAACKNASAMLFVSAKVSHLGLLPQGQPERYRRVAAMVRAMDGEGFGNCTVTGSCEAVCPKNINLAFIARLNRDYAVALLKGE